MKKFVAILVCLVVAVSYISSVYAFEETIKDVFPDDNFRALVMEYIDTDDENAPVSLWADKLSEIKGFYAGNRQISSFEGIEYLPGIETLDISQNEICEVDLDSLKKLEILIADNNPLTEIDLSGNLSLRYVYLHNCRLSQVKLSEKIEKLYLQNNGLESIDLTKHKSLSELNLSGNLLSEIDLSDNSSLKYLWVAANRLEKVLLPHGSFENIDLGEQHFSVGLKKDGAYSLPLDIVACSVNHSGGAFEFCMEDLPGYVECIVKVNGYPMSVNFDAVDFRGDINGDDFVNYKDLSYLLENYSTSESLSDIDKSGKVDSNDLSILLSSYGKTVNKTIK